MVYGVSFRVSRYFYVARLKCFLKVVYSEYFKGAVSTKSVTLALQRFPVKNELHDDTILKTSPVGQNHSDCFGSNSHDTKVLFVSDGFRGLRTFFSSD